MIFALIGLKLQTECFIEATYDMRKNARNSIAGLGASSLKELATALWAVPGVNLAYGAASCGLSIKENFSQARILIFDNNASNAASDHSDRMMFLHRDDWNIQIEKASEYIFNDEDKQFLSEMGLGDDSISYYGFTFWSCSFNREMFGLTAPITSSKGKKLYGAIVDLVARIVTVENVFVRHVDSERMMKSLVTKFASWEYKIT